MSPVEIQVVQDGKPVENVLVALYSEMPQGTVGCSALTNSHGTAILKTSVQSQSANGVSPGNYKVVLTKDVVLPAELSDFEAEQLLSESERSAMQKKRDDFLNKNRVVPKTLETPGTTPIILEVKPKEKNSLIVDVAKHQ
ncbi:MAG: hypothetical protein FWE67_08055 [Planctomycetaceae bacterium]|nr:hypothetical protein [Planctomycetaceae bacterium]